jgi:zinc protease
MARFDSHENLRMNEIFKENQRLLREVKMVSNFKRAFRMALWVILIACFATVFFHSPAGMAKTVSPLEPYTKIKLDNGLTLIVKEVHSAPIAAVDIWVGTGAKNETPEIAGISHFFEHMLFKGTAKRKVGEIAQEIKAVGGYQNAETSLDTTHYYVVVPSDKVNLALDVEADAVMNSTFDPQEIERERQVILEEKRLKEDNPQGKLSLMIVQTLFKGTPYANDVLGTSETLAKINHDTFVSYYQRYYRPDNVVAVVVGDVNSEQIIDQARLLFKDFKGTTKKPALEFQVPKIDKVERVTVAMQVDQTYLYFGFPGPGMNHRDEAALSVLGVILGGGAGSRLNQELLEKKQLVNEIAAGYNSMEKLGMFIIYARLKKEQTVTLESEVQKMISRIINQRVTSAELIRAKAMLRSDIAYTTESNANIASIIGEYQINGDLQDAAQYLTNLQDVTAKDVQRVAKTYLNPKAYVLAQIVPQEVNNQ